MKKRNELTGMYKAAYMRMEKEIDRKPLLENKVYETRKERLLLWIVCPMIYISCMLLLDLLTGEEGISSYEISTAMLTCILINMILIERKYHTSD